MSGREDGKQEKGEAKPNNVNIQIALQKKKLIMSVGNKFSLYNATIIYANNASSGFCFDL